MPLSKSKCQKQWLILIKIFITYNIIFATTLSLILKAPWTLSSNDTFFWPLSWTLPYVCKILYLVFELFCLSPVCCKWQVEKARRFIKLAELHVAGYLYKVN